VVHRQTNAAAAPTKLFEFRPGTATRKHARLIWEPELAREVEQAVEREHLTVDTVFAMHQEPVAWSEVVGLLHKAASPDETELRGAAQRSISGASRAAVAGLRQSMDGQRCSGLDTGVSESPGSREPGIEDVVTLCAPGCGRMVAE
jgi:hypothetical protein